MSEFNKREYEPSLDDLKLPANYLGFTNRILIQQTSESETTFFIPTYLVLKIKSIQDIDILKLAGSISCIIVVYVLVDTLPAPLVHMLENNIEMQINRSEVLLLKHSRENSIILNKSKDKKMLKFTLRRNVSATIISETFWSPFEIIKLIISITFNSIFKRTFQKETLNKIDQSHEEKKTYTLSFNCMRNGAKIPIGYSVGCVYSLYDIAEKKLDAYHTNIDSYSEVIRKSKVYENERKKDRKNKNQKEKEKQNEEKIIVEKLSDQENCALLKKFVGEVFSSHFGKKSQNYKAKYFQYTHFVVPLYKYPGNSLATIFIPIFLLALLSLAIFFQPNSLSDRISSIATMILGYIALIPSIKKQIPPSSKITILEIVIYISTLCCLFALLQSFLINKHYNYYFDWKTNILFQICLGIHIGVFLVISILMLLHIFVWEPSYNLHEQIPKAEPDQNSHLWINPYCDYEFYRVNKSIEEYNSKHNKKLKLIAKYGTSNTERRFEFQQYQARLDEKIAQTNEKVSQEKKQKKNGIDISNNQENKWQKNGKKQCENHRLNECLKQKKD